MPPPRAADFGFDGARAGALRFAFALALIFVGAFTLVFLATAFLLAVFRFAALLAVLRFADFVAVFRFADFGAVLRFAAFVGDLRFARPAGLRAVDFFAALRLPVAFFAFALALVLVLRAILESPCLEPVFLKPYS
ncbi:MAG: hypothetical protein WD711_13375 [Dongiaceae bacterium]